VGKLGDGVRQVLAICVTVLACGWLAGQTAPPARAPATLSVADSPPGFDWLQDGTEQLPPPRKLEEGKPGAAADDCLCGSDTGGARRSFLAYILGLHERSKWQPIGQHSRMFGDAAPVLNNKASKPKAPTTFPQALKQYLKCVRSHGRDLERKDDGKKEDEKSKDGKNDGDKKDKDGKNGPPEGSQVGTQAPPASAQQPGSNGQQPVPIVPATRPDDLGAERGGKTINIGGETGLAPTGYESSWFSAHAQGTVVDGVHDHFHSPYIGPLSLLPVEPHATSETTTFYFAARLWEGFEWVFNPEVAGGLGFSGSNGVAGFPNGEITRVGVVEPTPYLARLYFRQTIGFGGEQEKLEDGVNQIAGTRDINHLIIAAGKFSMTDVVDDNKYSHDPRTQFLAWSLMYNGAWDYPANVRGYTYGIAIDYNEKYWAIHYAICSEPRVANGSALDPNFIDGNGQALEWLGRYKINEHPGNIRLLSYLNHARMGNYGDALREMPVDPNVTLTRVYRFKYGFGLSWDQEVTRDVGIFGRWGWNDGHSEAWAFTAIDRLWELGVWVNGRPWCRPHDQFGTAFCSNGLEGSHRAYLAAGGLDFNIGDGKLNYGHEMIWESVYNLGITKNILFSLDFQEVFNPAYNKDRGPVSVFLGRFHIEF
jgi:high affinity Mn2+ porin